MPIIFGDGTTYKDEFNYVSGQPEPKEDVFGAPKPSQKEGTDRIEWNSLSKKEQDNIFNNSYRPATDGELNKYDETLGDKGSVVLPKDSLGPDDWQDKLFDKNILRYDLPDGTIILRKRPIDEFTSSKRQTDLSSSPITKRSAWDKLTGSDGGERYQLWPEKAVREVLDNVRTFVTTEPGSEANIQASTRMAFDLGLGGLSAAQKGSAGVFGGLLNAGKQNPSIKEMIPRLEKALPEEEVTRLTGWWKGKDDGKWRFEIPDKDAVLDNTNMKEMVDIASRNKTGASQVDLDGLLTHNKLYEIYPELQNFKVVYSKDWDHSIATFDQTAKQITVGPKFAELSETGKIAALLHEVQHGIQNIEGFSRGSSPARTQSGQRADTLEKLLEKASDKARADKSSVSDAEISDIKAGYAKLIELRKQSFNEYRNIPGEAEAHNIEYRYYMDKLGRDKGTPQQSEIEVTKNFK